jgi:hypothetical protein
MLWCGSCAALKDTWLQISGVMNSKMYLKICFMRLHAYACTCKPLCAYLLWMIHTSENCAKRLCLVRIRSERRASQPAASRLLTGWRQLRMQIDLHAHI